MNLFTLSVAFLRANPLNSLLNLLLLTLGMGTIVVLLLISEQLEEKLLRDARGIDLVIGAKGSPLQLILSSIYHTDIPTGNISQSELDQLITHKWVKTAIPLALGDNYHGYRIVGTTLAYPLHYQAKLTQGRFWQHPLEAVLGAEVARKTGLKIGDHFIGAHGLTHRPNFKDNLHENQKYTITGLLKPTGTVIDRLILTNVETVWQVHSEQHTYADKAYEITAMLIQYQSPLAVITFPRMINSQSTLQAASPAYETARLLKLVGFGIDTLRAFGLLLILMAILSMFIALYHSLTERRYELAIMRTLGASKTRLLWQLLFEGILLAILGTLLGLLLGHLITELLGLWLNQQFQFTGWTYVTSEAWLLPLALLIGTGTALLPAIQAYRTDIAKILSQA